MWTREQLKTKAKDILRQSYWWAFLVCFVFTIISGFGSGSSNYRSSSISNTGSGTAQHVDISEFTRDMTPEQRQAAQKFADTYLHSAVVGTSIAAALISIVISIFKIAFNLFITNPLTVGYNRYFLKQREGDVNFAHLFGGFTGGKYWSNFKNMFFYRLYIALWTLLFIIPGIIKTYSYFMVPYIIADNPDISKDRAFDISMKTMDGEKWDCFVLQLSFIGWQLLGLLCCCVGIYFVAPYVQTTMTEFYAVMRQKAIDKGVATYEDFNITPDLGIDGTAGYGASI